MFILVYILQVDFSIEGPFSEDMAHQFSDLAKSINKEPGFLWKIWTENEYSKEAGGIYAFETENDAQNYLTMHSKRLASIGVNEVNAKIFTINETLTKITHGPIY